ncbi:MAG: LysR substrate-binding domain-containing protein [Bradymonadia bacterium]
MDRIAALEAFVRVVERGSFSAAARDLRVGQPTISKWIARLEDTFEVQLLDRTTRSVSVTDAGHALYTRGRAVLDAWESALSASGEQALRGRLRVSVPVVFGQLFLSPLLSQWMRAHPEVELEIIYSDRYVNLVEEGVDVAIRVGRPVDSSHRATLLARSSRRLVAAPAYLASHGTPESPEDLVQHRCLLHGGLSVQETWVLSLGDVRHTVPISGRLSANSSATLRYLAVEGHGVALLADWLVEQTIREGRLVPLLSDYALPSAPIRAVFASSRHVAPRVRAFVAHLEATLPNRLAQGPVSMA